jgi:multidrug transporter EmrE-like cation transporter
MSLVDVSALSIAEIVGDFGFKAFARGGGVPAFAQGAIGYVGVIYFLIRSLRVSNILYLNGMWDGVSAVLETIAAYVILGERLNRPIEYVGLLAIIMGIFLLHAPDGKIPYN